MARMILTTVLIVLLNVLVGCHSADSGRSQLVPARSKAAVVAAVEVGKTGETDIIEQMAVNRRAYRHGLELLIAHYNNKGNNMKLAWAEDELKKLDEMPQYNYIIEASVAGPNLKATTLIAEAELMYMEAMRLEKKAKKLVVIKNEDLLRQALEQYNQLIRKHPSSDKIDDAAFRSAGIFEYFKDYTIALLYYQRAYQWDSNTPYPAEYKAARILDRHLHRRAEALELYHQAVKREGMSRSYRDLAEMRITELTKSDEVVEENK